MTKISKILKAGRNLEKDKTGFTIMELMSSLGWDDSEKQYLRSTMFQLTKRGQAHKLNNGRPVIYTLKPHAGARIQNPQSFKPANDQMHKQTLETGKQETTVQTDQQSEPASSKPPPVSLENLHELGISLEDIGEGVFRRNRELARRIYQLESELIEIKRMLDDANKRIAEQTRMIEKQNQIISDQNQESRPRFPSGK